MANAEKQAITLDLVTPERLLSSRQVQMAVVPGGEGYFGVLHSHAPLIAAMKAGVISVYENDNTQVSERIFVSGGFVEVTGERCTILATDAVSGADIDAQKAKESLTELMYELEKAENEEQKKTVQAKIAIAQAMVDAVS